MESYKGIFKNIETRDTYRFLTSAGSYADYELSSCMSPRDVLALYLDNSPTGVDRDYLDKVDFDEIFELIVRR